MKVRGYYGSSEIRGDPIEGETDASLFCRLPFRATRLKGH